MPKQFLSDSVTPQVGVILELGQADEDVGLFVGVVQDRTPGTCRPAREP